MHIPLVLLAGSLAGSLAVAASQVAAQSASRPPILRTPAKVPACTVEQQRVGRDSVPVTHYNFISRARDADRDIDLLVDSTGQVLMFSDIQSHPAPGDTSRSTGVMATLARQGGSGVVSVTSISRSEIQRKMLANGLRLPPMTAEEKQQAMAAAVPLSAEELDRARALGAWLLDQRATCEAPRRWRGSSA